MEFFNKIIVHPLQDGHNWITEDWVAVSLDGKGLVYIPKAFRTDFGSIARFLWAIVGAPATGKHRRAVLFHDWLYSTQTVPRKEADDICLEIMKEDGANALKRYTIYFGVRVGGQVAWNRKTEELKHNYIKLQQESYGANSISYKYNIYA